MQAGTPIVMTGMKRADACADHGYGHIDPLASRFHSIGKRGRIRQTVKDPNRMLTNRG